MENSYIIILTLVLLGFLLLKEIQRKNKANLILRVAASCLAVIALIFIAIPITYQKKAEPKDENTIVLITEGFQKDSLDKFKNIPVFTTNPAVAKGNKSVELIPDLAGFLAMNQQLSKFHILGYGLADQELESIQDKNLVFHLSPLPSGLQSVHWNKTIKSGERLVLSGNYRNSSDKPVKLILNGLGTNLDSVNIPAGKSENFQLQTIPKHLDKAVYALIGITEKDSILNENVPVFVQVQAPLKVLILSSSPDFENKFLKNWLFENQYSIAVRSAISKSKFSTEFLNSTRINLDRITPSVLENFDVLISDPNELSALSRAENQAIQNQLSNGMGLIMIADSIPEAEGFFNRIFETKALVRADEKTISLSWDDYNTKKMSLGLSGSFRILPKDGNQALVMDDKANIIVSSKLSGRGRILLSSITDTYTWILGNDLKSYSSYWSELIGNVARKKELSSVWALKDPLPALNQETSIIIETGSDSIPVARSEAELLKFEQNPVLGFQWTAPYWPQKTGWQLLETGNSPDSVQSWFYVFNKNDWASVHAVEKIKNNRKFSEESFTESNEQNISVRYYREEVPPVYFFILFLLSCTYLWLEAKKF
ncbi:MAG: hypothetical protein B7X86_10875 [Sphingobacteriales bacterium 17-39-43]|uniref:hypothetical protein n=1 Tax=Daejeonella sp. TaxID=2805397 RepID=UPI000BD66A20|nr:hypothetical protein [Daejeonella sp.]OYZ31021.1 MAG: hypothetical protein B7Y24_11270 [Sphingobacteriales bacterium 16-39-50]OZA23752.1 MAG: hypothetical protein B7X86_10875 [Sphingobacteriales bacterium 17-39-43]HQT22725.1 hypothetical protein [Daejeonella sp.]HQT57800.1 hypothetical protein [Daejeonella sp.]